MIPEMLRTAGLEVPNGALAQPFCRVSPVNPVADSAKEAPSSEVKHWALEKGSPLCCCTVTTPLGAMSRRPFVALHRSTGTKTLVDGRNDAGRTNGSGLVPDVAMAPLKWTIPPITAAQDWPVLTPPPRHPSTPLTIMTATA